MAQSDWEVQTRRIAKQWGQVPRLNETEMFYFRMLNRLYITITQTPELPWVQNILKFDESLPKIGYSFKIVISANI